jgi:hypothetical protein
MSHLIGTLKFALSRKRPHRGEGERALRNHLHRKMGGFVDEHGNLHIDMRGASGSRTLFVAHMDTVHRKDGGNLIEQNDRIWRAAGGQPLGADDGAGVAILTHLCISGVPAYYVFTVGEECGGVGASALAKDVALLGQFDRAIAFDRRGIDSVITHQGFGRCCSDAFGQALADALNDQDTNFMYSPDDTGVYTDTAEFTDIIPECTNISVGYDHEHSDKESLDMLHFKALAEAVARINWEALPTERDPMEVEDRYAGRWGSLWALDDKEDKGTKRGRAYTTEMQLYDALDDAYYGRRLAINEMLSEAISPEDPSIARKIIDGLHLEQEWIDDAWDALDQDVDAYTILIDLFELMQEHSAV